MKLREARTALLLAVLLAVAACGKYGEPMRTGPGARRAPAASAPTLTPASGETSEAECPPDSQPKQAEAKATPR